jgi:hypothetical protein
MQKHGIRGQRHCVGASIDPEHHHPFTVDPGAWCPCSEHALVERSADGETERPAWLLTLPCSQERALRAAAKRARLTREEWLAKLIRAALTRAGGDA